MQLQTKVTPCSPFEVGLSETGPTNNQMTLTVVCETSKVPESNDPIAVKKTIRDSELKPNNSRHTPYSTYHQNKLILSNDVETQPGPRSRFTYSCQYTLLLQILSL